MKQTDRHKSGWSQLVYNFPDRDVPHALILAYDQKGMIPDLINPYDF